MLKEKEIFALACEAAIQANESLENAYYDYIAAKGSSQNVIRNQLFEEVHTVSFTLQIPVCDVLLWSKEKIHETAIACC